MSEYSARMRKYAENEKAKVLAENKRLWDEAVKSVQANEKQVKASWEDFVEHYVGDGQTQRAANESIAEKAKEIYETRKAVDAELEETRQTFEALNAEFNIY